MTIAGIKAEYDMRELIEHKPAYVPHGIDLYTAEQVREILIKQFAELVEYPFTNPPAPERYGEVVDSFMKRKVMLNEI